MKISFAAAALLLATTNAAENATLPRGSPGCGKVVKEIGRIKQVSQFKVDGADRGFRTYTPKTYDKDTPQPLILAFHGHGKTQPSFARNSRFSLPTINPNMMVQYMMAGGNRWYGPPNSTRKYGDDVRYTELVLDYLMDNYCVDVDRVYLVGHTGGGGLANIIACDPRFSRHFAGMALMGPSLYRDLDDDYCKHARLPMPILEVHGIEDHTSPYEGAPDRVIGALPSIADWIRRWVRRNECDPVPQQATQQGKFVDEKVTSDKYTCQGQHGFVEHIKVLKHGYSWLTDKSTIDVTPLIIDFLQRHIRPGNLSIPLDADGKFSASGQFTPPSGWTPPSSGNSTWDNSTNPGNSTKSVTWTSPAIKTSTTYTIPGSGASPTTSTHPGSDKKTSSHYGYPTVSSQASSAGQTQTRGN